MPKRSRPRYGSLQFWPRKRASKAIHSVNWKPIIENKLDSEGLLGFIAYKVGMCSAIVKDNTQHSMTKGKKIAIPTTTLEVPNMKIYSVRFYKSGIVIGEIVVSNDKVLKRKVRVPKEAKKLEHIEGFDDIRVIVYSVLKGMFKKSPDIIEVAINSNDKLGFIKQWVGKEIGLNDILKWDLVDVRGLTKGKGFSGPVKRFGIKLKPHKSEKGVRRPGSLGPWHPARVSFRVPMAGQLGMFSRIHYNLKVIDFGNVKEKNINKKGGFKHYGVIKNNYVILAGSVQGPSKRQILITPAMRPTKKQIKKKYELLELR
ncbi:MAG: 50S ribosomal protein L3 [Nanoarchaeota archaeon]|nr:50S ribosomal protein L3 [Nanoarchaeota archaeon]